MFRYSLRRITRMILYTSSFSWLLLSSRVACMADFHPSTSPSPVPIFHIITRSQTWPVHVGKRLPVLFSVAHSSLPWPIRPQHFARFAFFFSSHHVSVSVPSIAEKKCGTFSSFRWLSLLIYHINILRNQNKVDAHWGRRAKPK